MTAEIFNPVSGITTKPKADYRTDEFFGIAGAVDVLSRAAQDHCQPALSAAATVLDMAVPDLLRGCAYLAWLLAQDQEYDRNADAARKAEAALAEMSALAAVLIELKNRADIVELIHEREAAVEQARAA